MKMVDDDYGIPDGYDAKFNDCGEIICINYLIEENGNCYQPQELCGLYIKHLTLDEVKEIVGEIDINDD